VKNNLHIAAPHAAKPTVCAASVMFDFTPQKKTAYASVSCRNHAEALRGGCGPYRKHTATLFHASAALRNLPATLFHASATLRNLPADLFHASATLRSQFILYNH
jgi:hypothetical protein